MGLAFKKGEYVVYPAHGVGEIVDTEEHAISGICISVYVIHFSKTNMTIRLPVVKADSAGLRPLVSHEKLADILEELSKPIKVEKTLWKKKSAEYEKKLNSGDLFSIANVLRALHQENFTSMSYTKKELYQAALMRLSEEISVVKNLEIETAEAVVKNKLNKLN